MPEKAAQVQKRPLIMSVDDDQRMRNIIERFLTTNGYDVVFAGSGSEALGLVSRGSRPDLILLDVMMPIMNGYEVCARLQDNKDTAYTPVIFATALGEERDKAKAFAAGGVDYLTKPFQKDVLLEKVRAHLPKNEQWKDMSRAEGKKAAPPVEKTKDLAAFKKFLLTQEGLDEEDAKGLMSAAAGELYQQCGKLGVTSGAVAQHISEFMKLPYIAHINPKDVLLGVLPTRFCRTNHVIALSDVSADFAFALSNPFDWQLHDVFAHFTGLGQTYRTIMTDPENIRWLFEMAEATHKEPEAAEPGVSVMPTKGIASAATEPNPADGKNEADLAESAQKAPVIKLANALISRAIHAGASDIHVEPRENSVGVRYRIDGMLQEGDPIPKSLQAPLISRIKIMSNMDISERRLPQDGRIRIAIQGKNVDLRVSTLPSRHGEKVVIRILDSSAVSLDFDALGLEEGPLAIFRDSIKKPHGIILVTGPTGSGKSTTLYTALQALNEPTTNIVTVEDPIEYEMHRITQVQVNPDTGLTFPAALRSILRQDPDVIMIGEIRDRETMDIAVRAALTGHLVLSTLHTNDAPSTIARLIDMGLEPYLVASSLELVVAQRLLRRLCPDCKKPTDAIPDDIFERYGVTKEKGAGFYQPTGCDRCAGTGYKGRLAVMEVMRIDDETRRLISLGRGVEVLKARAVEKGGMTTLRQNAFIKASRGMTSLDEVIRATGSV